MKDISSASMVKHYMATTVLGDIFQPDVVDVCRLFEYENGDLICVEGEEVRYLHFLLEGKAKPYDMLANGKVYLFRIESPLVVYGDLEVLKNKPYTANVEAVGQALCLAVPISYVHQHCLSSPVFLRYIINSLADRLDMISRGSAENLLMPLKNKLAVILLEGLETGNTYFEINSSYAEMAENLGTTYRHLSRVLKEMSEEGLIEKEGKAIRILDKEQLAILVKEMNR